MNECFLKVSCMPQIGCKPLRLPFDHDSFAPFVEAKFINETNQEITSVTVGNESYKTRPNTAVIKSMEYGFITKPEAVLEIIDEAGGELGLFVDALRKCGNNRIGPGARVLLKFGWVKTDCEGYSSDNRITFQGFISLLVTEIEISYEKNLVKYTIKCDASNAITTNQREDGISGRSSPTGPKMRLTEAIERLCATKNIIVVYAREDGDGTIKTQVGVWPENMSAEEAPWIWEHHGVNGPRGSWQGDNNDVLSTISRWLEPYRIQDGPEGAGIKMVFDSKNFDRLFLWKDPGKSNIRCSNFQSSDEGNNLLSGGGTKKRGYLGTFIVNGGKCSPVLNFDPKFNFISGLARKNTGGNASGVESSNSVYPENEDKEEENCKEDNKRTGPENNATIPQHAKENYPPNLVNKETLRSNIAHIKANMLSEFKIANLQADMTIIGTPVDKFVDLTLFLNAPVSVIVLNPFYIAGNMNGDCGDWSWLANTGCNQLLSDYKYICVGLNHSIKEGSYVTTLKLINPSKSKQLY